MRISDSESAKQPQAPRGSRTDSIDGCSVSKKNSDTFFTIDSDLITVIRRPAAGGCEIFAGDLLRMEHRRGS